MPKPIDSPNSVDVSDGQKSLEESPIKQQQILELFEAAAVREATADYLMRGIATKDSRESRHRTEPSPTVDFQELSRAMLLCRVPCDAAIAMAIRRYLDVLKDIHSLESLQNETVEAFDNMLNRYRVYHRQDLESLGVKLEEVRPGLPVDPAFHEVVERHPTRRAPQVNTVALALTPLMTWKDSLGSTQLRPAKVIAYVRSDAVDKTVKVAALRGNGRSYR